MSYTEAICNINKIIADSFSMSKQVIVLEAGSGSITRIKLPFNNYIIGIDVSLDQLRMNETLNCKICAYLNEVSLKENSIDLISCWDVIEHLKCPNVVIDQFMKWIKPGGLIILKNPNPYSVKGIVTKFTPHFFHVIVHKFIFRSYKKNPHYLGPFKTYMNTSIHYKEIIQKVKESESGLVYLHNYTGLFRFRKLYYLIALITRFFTRIIEVESEQVLVIKRKYSINEQP